MRKAAAKDGVFADAPLLALLEGQFLLANGQESIPVEAVDHRGHIAVDVDPARDQRAFVVLAGKREQDTGFDRREIGSAEQRAFLGADREAQRACQDLQGLAPTPQSFGIARLDRSNQLLGILDLDRRPR